MTNTTNTIPLLETTRDLQDIRKIISPDAQIGFVPTMGNLHQGHLSLIQESLKQNQMTVVSIFVNPKQFGPTEDFTRYPRTLDEDLKKIDSLERKPGVNLLVYAPHAIEEIYPPAFSTTITVDAYQGILCDQNRPGHFAGVTTVVYQLLAHVRPHKCYLGEKDYQQYMILKKMASDLQLPSEIVPLPLVRDERGLALSSRNRYLKASELPSALKLSELLKEVDQLYTEHREDRHAFFKAFLQLKKNQQSTEGEHPWDYIEVGSQLDLSLLHEGNIDNRDGCLYSHPLRAFCARNINGTRLIDNLELGRV